MCECVSCRGVVFVGLLVLVRLLGIRHWTRMVLVVVVVVVVVVPNGDGPKQSQTVPRRGIVLVVVLVVHYLYY